MPVLRKDKDSGEPGYCVGHQSQLHLPGGDPSVVGEHRKLFLKMTLTDRARLVAWVGTKESTATLVADKMR